MKDSTQKLTEIKKLYDESIDLFKRINQCISGDKLEAINIKLSGAIKDLNELIIREIESN